MTVITFCIIYMNNSRTILLVRVMKIETKETMYYTNKLYKILYLIQIN